MATRSTNPAVFLVLTVMLVALPLAAHPYKTILLVFDEDSALPGLAAINSSLRDAFREDLGGEIEFWSESLNVSQFKEAGYQDLLRDYFSNKYSSNPPDLIVAVMQPSLDFLLLDNRPLFPGVPIVFCGIDSSHLQKYELPPNVTGVAMERTYAPTVDIALRLQPDTRTIFVIGGTTAFDRQIQAIARRDLARFGNRVRISFLTDLPMPQLIATVSRLPEKSAILYLTLFADGEGRAFVPHDVVARISRNANAPIYVAVDQYLDRGVVGGHVYSLESHGRHAAKLGTRILRGETAPNTPVIEQMAYADIFDWRQLHRWDLDESLLPAGSEVRHREQSLWSEYKAFILAGIAILLLQSALIVGLLFSRAARRRAHAATREAEARRRQAEEEVRRQRDELAHALRLTTLGELAASFAHDLGQPLTAILTNAQAVHRMVEQKAMSPEEISEAVRDIEGDVARAAETIQRLRGMFRKQHAEREHIDLNEMVEDVVRLLHAEMMGKDIHVEFRPEAGLPRMIGDPVQLRQVILNLVVNAEEAIVGQPDGEREITIETRSIAGDEVGVIVRDTGSGLQQGKLEWMFERFATSKPSGLGMGLAISRSIVQAHDGRIWATQNGGPGLAMHLQFPAAGLREPDRGVDRNAPNLA